MVEVPLGGNTLVQGSFGEKNHNFGLEEEEEEGDLKRRKGFYLHSFISSHIFLLLLISMVIFILFMS